MEPIDRRVTVAQLLAARMEPGAAQAIAQILEVTQMDPVEALQTKKEIEAFVASGDATAASQLIHAASVRRHPPRSRLRS